MAAIKQLPQPDFHALSGHLQGMALEVDRCANLAALHHTRVILDAIAGLTNTVNTAVAELRTEIRSLERRIDDFDFNSRARTANSAAIKAEAIIRPLRNTTTHEVVALPRTTRELSLLRVGDVEQYLRALGQDPVGNAKDKKAQLKDYLGLIV